MDDEERSLLRSSGASYALNRSPCPVTVKELTYVVKKRTGLLKQNVEEKVVLNDVSFTANPGQLVAVVGSSGGGKSSLLDVIANRHDGRIPQGAVYFGDVPRNQGVIRECMGYVAQDDRLLAHLTVRETLRYVAALRLPAHMKTKDRERRVDEVIGELGLLPVADVPIGDREMRGISGGERRRVSIGVQLLIDPSVLLLDEPTSGLDAFTARAIVHLLANLARAQRTVICSIHQPRSDVFSLFDSVLLLSRGEVVYFGPGKDMIEYFEVLGYPCPAYVNPLDHVVDVASLDFRSAKERTVSSARIDKLVSTYKSAVARERSRYQVSSELTARLKAAASGSTSHPLSRLRQFAVLFARSARNMLRGYKALLIELLQSVVMGVIVGAVFWQMPLDQGGIRDRFGLFYIITSIFPFIVILSTIATVDAERPALYSERLDYMYDLFPFFASKVLSELPFHVLCSLTYSLPIYAMTGMQHEWLPFWHNQGFILLAMYASRSLASFMASALPDFYIACFIANFVFTLFLLPAGFICNLDTMWKGVKWISDVSYIRRSFEGLAYSEFEGLTFSCSTLPDGTPLPTCIPSGNAALVSYSLGDTSLVRSMWVLLAIIGVFRVGSYAAMRFVPQRPVMGRR